MTIRLKIVIVKRFLDSGCNALLRMVLSLPPYLLASCVVFLDSALPRAFITTLVVPSFLMSFI